jgi:hypothetical protein
LRDANGNTVGTYLVGGFGVVGGRYLIWDDTAGGFITYSQYTGESWNMYQHGRYLTADCTGPRYAQTASTSPDNSIALPLNTILRTHNQLYKISSVSVQLTPGTPVSLRGHFNDDPNFCLVTTLGSGEGGTYNRLDLVTASNLPIALAMPVRVERQ